MSKKGRSSRDSLARESRDSPATPCLGIQRVRRPQLANMSATGWRARLSLWRHCPTETLQRLRTSLAARLCASLAVLSRPADRLCVCSGWRNGQPWSCHGLLSYLSPTSRVLWAIMRAGVTHNQYLGTCLGITPTHPTLQQAGIPMTCVERMRVPALTLRLAC
jgi:hypothetical protein